MLNEDGHTTSTREKILTITVDKGWKEGTKITFPKEGDQGPNRIPGKQTNCKKNNNNTNITSILYLSADIIFEVKDKPHPRFSRQGIDLTYKPSISLLMVSIKALCDITICS